MQADSGAAPCRGWETGRIPQKNRTRQTGQASLTAPAEAGKLAGYLKNPYPANWAGVPDGPCRGWEAGRVPQMCVLGQLRRRPKPPRGLGKYQNAPLKVSDASESVKTRRWRFPRGRKASKHAAERFRGLGKHQNAPLKISEGSEGRNKLFEGFRGCQGHLPRLPGTSNVRTRPTSPAAKAAPADLI